ncbi:MAG: hypothetical protein IV086_00955 [Hyphomonadaceae bacterium]|nr:hypothetical protein [Hyphomonadaceae bacterium]TPW01757.1 MAG: hypothetical protein FD124_3621 [Alphaproteobacteria bacterium]
MKAIARLATLLAAVASLAACATTSLPTPAASYFENLRTLCGKTHEGRLVTNDPPDATFADKRLVMGPVDCREANEVRIPFAVGENRSRTWVLSRVEGDRIRLKHDHRHADGSEDILSQYGGDSIDAGISTRQYFPADAYSRDLFVRQNLPRSLTNMWSVVIEPGAMFAYELRRADRHFRVEFDLAATAPAP